MAKEHRELSPELWEDIGKRLLNHVDIQVFRSTCKLWRSVLPKPSPYIFPLDNIPPPPHLDYHPSEVMHSIVEHTGYLFEFNNHSEPFFLALEPKPDTNGQAFSVFSVLSPYDTLFKSRSEVLLRWYWSWRRSCSCPYPHKEPPTIIDSEQLRASFVFKSYYLHSPRKSSNGETCSLQKIELFSYYTDTKKLAPINPQFASNNGVDLVVVALSETGEIAHLTIDTTTSRPMEWKSVRQSCKFDDIINYGGKLWAVDYYGGSFVMNDFFSLSMTQVVASPIIFHKGKCYLRDVKTSKLVDCYVVGRIRFVEASGDLFMLFPCRHDNNRCTNQIKVFKLLKSSGNVESYLYEWAEVESIGKKAFFVGRGFSFSMDVGPESLWVNTKGNCIFLNSSAFIRSYPTETDCPLFMNVMCSGPTSGEYSLVDKDFRIFSRHDCPPITCSSFTCFVFDRERSRNKMMRARKRQKIREGS